MARLATAVLRSKPRPTSNADLRRHADALNSTERAGVARVMSLAVLAASIAHEINQPLTGIVTNASTCLRMLNSDLPDVEGARETVRRTIRDVNRASAVIARLRALYAKKDAVTEQVDLNEVTREVLSMSMSELQRSRARGPFGRSGIRRGLAGGPGDDPGACGAVRAGHG
jgi:C4-dicarboxylate-specific signal transduction histidine kinase